jgi:putative hydrolase of the HAD superfamily
MNNVITTVAFDFGGVLSKPIDNGFLTQMADVLGADADRFAEALWKHRHSFDIGDMRSDAYWKAVSQDCGADLAKLDSGIAEETIELLMHFDALAWSSINPAMLRWAAALRREGFRLLIISNMAAETYDMILRDSYLLKHFERVVLSGWLHINKPDREIYLEAVRQMDVPPGEVLFIDDLLPNIEGARSAGLHALQFLNAESLALALEEQHPSIPRTGLR